MYRSPTLMGTSRHSPERTFCLEGMPVDVNPPAQEPVAIDEGDILNLLVFEVGGYNSCFEVSTFEEGVPAWAEREMSRIGHYANSTVEYSNNDWVTGDISERLDSSGQVEELDDVSSGQQETSLEVIHLSDDDSD